MISEKENNKRIAKNTLLLYFRMIFMMVISLYTSRVNLNALGIDNFGIYNVVGGVVAMSGLFTAALSSSISRFLTFELGKGNKNKLNSVFSTSVSIQFCIAFIILILGETIGLWFLNEKLVIPDERLYAANWVYQFSLISCFVGLISVPYNAAIIAHEKMSAFAYISIIEAIGKLLVAFSIMITPIDKLIWFSGFILVNSLVIRFIYGYYCGKHFEECRYHFVFDKTLLKNMFGYAGWNFLGSCGAVLRDQGGNIIINLFCGPAVNAARGVSVQVNTAVIGFVTNFMTALNPQITKSYACGNKPYMYTLIQQGSRLSFYILLFLACPILVNTEYILQLWLKIPPQHAAEFIRLVLLFALSESISHTIITAMQATGNIRNFQLTAGLLQLLNLPLAYFCLWLGGPPEVIFCVSIFISQISFFVRLYMLHNAIGISIAKFIHKVYINVLCVSIIAVSIPFLIGFYLEKNFLTFILLCCICCATTSISILIVGCNQNERKFVLSKVKSSYYKMIKNR
jgi:O-antigen/teichoic acid export membrane protein